LAAGRFYVGDDGIATNQDYRYFAMICQDCGLDAVAGLGDTGNNVLVHDRKVAKPAKKARVGR
jgi:hypothetical protein